MPIAPFGAWIASMGSTFENSTDGEGLKTRLDGLLQGSLGLKIYPNLPFLSQSEGQEMRFSSRPFIAGARMAAVYLVFFAALPWLVFRHSDGGSVSLRIEPLIVLQLYGALWSGWAVASTRVANRYIFGTITGDLIPALSPEAIVYVNLQLDSRYTEPKPRRRLFLLSWGIGAAAAAIAGVLVSRDLPEAFKPSVGQILWWCLGWTLLYTTAAKVVIVSRFYEIFADALADGRQQLFWLNPAESAVVEAIAKVGRQMLLFWLAVALSIALIVPFVLYIAWFFGDHSVDHIAFLRRSMSDNSFMMAHLAGAAFFSIGIGSLVFLRSEATLRRAAGTASAAALRLIEDEVGGLPKGKLPAASDPKRLSDLRSLHADVAKGGSRRTLLFSGLSLIIPFVPLLTLLLKPWLQ